jgi:hypothetical protein
LRYGTGGVNSPAAIRELVLDRRRESCFAFERTPGTDDRVAE